MSGWDRLFDYRSPAGGRAKVSLRLARRMFRLSLVPSAGGVLLITLFALTDLDVLLLAGAAWVLGGGLMTIVLTAWAIVATMTLADRTGPVGKVRHYCYRTITMSGVSVVTAFACLVAGFLLIEYRPFRFEVENETAHPVEVTLLLPSGPVHVGTVLPETSLRTPKRRYDTNGPLDMIVRTKGVSATTRPFDSYDRDDYGDGTLRVGVGDADLPPGHATPRP